MAEMTANPAAQKHRVPVIDRMMEILEMLEDREEGATIRDLVSRLELPRTTIYRILNTLQLHDMVRRGGDGAYQLGRRLVRLGAHVASRSGEDALLALARPFLDALSARLGESCKLSAIDSEGVVVIGTAHGRRQYALSVTAGQRSLPHAGAAGRLLLAHLSPAEQARWVAPPLAGYTPRTITDPRRLATELARARRQGWAQDKGEAVPSIHAFAAPVFDETGTMVAAISVPFLAGTEAERMEEIRLAVIEASQDLSRAIASQARH